MTLEYVLIFITKQMLLEGVLSYTSTWWEARLKLV